MVCGKRRYDAVRANFPGIINQQLYSEIQRIIQHDRFFVTVKQRKLLKNRRQWRNNARQDDIIDIS